MIWVLLALAVLPDKNIYIVLDDSSKSKMLKDELTRDWTNTPNATRGNIPFLWLVGQDVKRFKKEYKIHIKYDPLMTDGPKYSFHKRRKWIRFKDKVFTENTWPYKTLRSHASYYYYPMTLKEMRNDFYPKLYHYNKVRSKELEAYISGQLNKGPYVGYRPIHHQPGWGNIYNVRTRKYEKHPVKAKSPPYPLYRTFSSHKEWDIAWDKYSDKYEEWKNTVAKELQDIVTNSKGKYALKEPQEHKPGSSTGLYNMFTRKYDYFNCSIPKPKMSEPRLYSLPWREHLPIIIPK
jgi:hypothetical protein